jgi:hypothetical protein
MWRRSFGTVAHSTPRTRHACRAGRRGSALGYSRYGVHGGSSGWSIGTTPRRPLPEAVVRLQPQRAPWAEPPRREPAPQEPAFPDSYAHFKAEGLGVWENPGDAAADPRRR